MTNGEFLQNALIALWAVVLQIRKQPASFGDHGEQSLAGGMVFLVCFEMLRQLSEAAAQKRNLNFRRACIGFVSLIAGQNLTFYVCRQCHSKRYCSLSSLYLDFGYRIRITQLLGQSGNRGAWQPYPTGKGDPLP